MAAGAEMYHTMVLHNIQTNRERFSNPICEKTPKFDKKCVSDTTIASLIRMVPLALGESGCKPIDVPIKAYTLPDMPPDEILDEDEGVKAQRRRQQGKTPMKITSHEVARGILKDTPSHPEALTFLGRMDLLCMTTGSYDAIEYLERSLDEGNVHDEPVYRSQLMISDTSSFETWYLLGRAYSRASGRATTLKRGRYLYAAYEAYRQAFLCQHLSSKLWMSIGILYFLVDQHVQCFHAFQRAMRMNSRMAMLWRNLGILVSSEG